MTYIHLLGGLIYLLMGADLLVRGAVALAHRGRVSPLVVALSVVALGTSLPELVVTVQALLADHPDVAFGNIIGSNIANVLLVAGAPAVVYPLACDRRTTTRDSTVLLIVSALFVAFCLNGELARGEGLVLVVVLATLLVLTGRAIAQGRERPDLASPKDWVLGLPGKTPMILLFIAAGLVGLPVGARTFVDAAVIVAGQLGVSDATIGLTVVAIGTSLPELATTVVAALKRHTDVAVGTVIGSCIFNLLVIMSVASLMRSVPLAVPAGFLTLDFPVMLAAALALAVLAWRCMSVGRAAGVVFLLGYVAYVLALLTRV